MLNPWYTFIDALRAIPRAGVNLEQAKRAPRITHGERVPS